MGFRTPQQVLQAGTPSVRQRSGRAVFRNPGRAQIRPNFINIAAQGFAEIQSQKRKAAQQRQDFLDALHSNQLETVKVRAQAEISQLRGADVYDKMPSIKRDYLNAVAEIQNSMPEDYKASDKANLNIIKTAGDLERFTIGHSYKETQRIQKDAFSAKVANDMNSLVENAGDIEFMKGPGLAQVEQSIRTKAKYEYGEGPEAKIIADQEAEIGVSKAIKNAIQYQLASENIGLAKQTVQEMLPRITEEDQIEMKKMLDRAETDQESSIALSIANEAQSIFGDNVEAQERYVTQLSDGNVEQYNKAMTVLRGRAAIRDKAEKDRQDDTHDRLYDQYMKTGDMDQRLLKSLEPTKKNELFKMINANGGVEPVISRPGELERVTDMLSAMDDETLAEYDVQLRHQGTLSAQDLKVVQKLKSQAVKRIQGTFSGNQAFKSGIYKDVAKSFEREVDKSDRRKLYRFLQERQLELIEQNPRLTDRDLRNTLIRETKDKMIGTVDGSGFFNTFFKTDKIDALDEDIGIRNRIPPQLMRKARDAYRILGKPEPTEAQIIDLLRRQGRLTGIEN
jgi:hypothetical protein